MSQRVRTAATKEAERVLRESIIDLQRGFVDVNARLDRAMGVEGALDDLIRELNPRYDDDDDGETDGDGSA